MYTRFPELAPPEISGSPTLDELESGAWCHPHFMPDESNVTMLNPGLSVAAQFDNTIPKYLWLQNGRQTVVAVSAPHLHDSNNRFYEDLRSLYGHFAAETNGNERVTLREGRIWPRTELTGSDAEIIANGAEGLYLQALAYRNTIECLSTEPLKDKDILTVMNLRPELRRAAIMYVKMRMLPQAYKNQQLEPPHNRLPILNYFRRFMAERRRHYSGSWTGAHLYSMNCFSGPGSLNAIGNHLTAAHGLHNDEGYPLQGYDIAEGSSEEVIDQVFRCINSPIFHAGDIAYDDLCDVQRVAVLVNRLRDRRMAYMLADLSHRGTSYFWMSGPPHYETLVPGLYGMAAEQALSSRNLQTELGLRAVRNC